MAKQLKGIDISEWQTGLDYTTMAKNLDFVILREGYRQTKDKMFATHVAGFRAAKLPIKGVYHFIYALNNQDAKREAESCLKNVEAAGLPKTTYIFADFEYDSVTKAAAKGVYLGPAECQLFTQTFCETIKAAGYPTGIYTNYDYSKRMYTDAILAKYPLWYAQYSGTKPNRDCMIWQYGSTGRVPGFWENLDMDIWFEEEASTQPDIGDVTIDQLAQEVIAGKWGNGDNRKAALGDRYEVVQKRVNEILSNKQPDKSIDELAKEVINGKYGIGDARRAALGDMYDLVQRRVNEILSTTQPAEQISARGKRNAYIRQMQSWAGLKESDGSFRIVIDTYNSGLAAAVQRWGTRNVRMQYDWAWCACTVSAAAMAAGVADIVPIEISCPYMIEEAKRAGIWVENDAYVPTPGDIIMYDWQDSGVGDNQGLADHVGMVERVNGNQLTIIEGNRNDSVSRRTIQINSMYIRGYIVPNF